MIERLSISYAEAKLLGEHTLAKAEEMFPGRPIAVAIVDIDDALVWGARMDGCKPDSAHTALLKAITGRYRNVRTLTHFADWPAQDILAAQRTNPTFMHWGGGAPIEFNNGHDPALVIGGLGVSGLKPEEDDSLVILPYPPQLGFNFPADYRLSS